MVTNATSKKFKGFGIWVLQIVAWVIRGLRHIFPYLALVLIVLSIAYFDGSITECKEQDIRWIGLLLQLIGFVIVLRQLNSRLRLFRKPSFLLRMKKFIEKFPSRHNKIFNLSSEAVSVTLSASRPELTINLSREASVEERIDVIEHEIKDVKKHLREMEELLGRNKAENQEEFDAVHGKIEAGHKELKRLIDEAVVGGVNMEWAGIVYFMVGIVLATISSEISLFLGHGRQCDLSV